VPKITKNHLFLGGFGLFQAHKLVWA